MGLRPCNRRENIDRNCRLGYLVIGWAIRPCDRRENLDKIVVWIFSGRMGLCSFDRRENLDSYCRGE